MNVLWFLLLFVILTSINGLNNEWVAPDAWSRKAFSEGKLDTAVCPTCRCKDEPTMLQLEHNNPDQVTSVYYAKLMKFIFKRNQMEYDDSSESYSRHIIFKITSKQLKILEQSTDPRDWDSVLAEALPQAELPNEWSKNDMISEIIASTKYYIQSTFISSELRFTLLIVAFTVLMMYINRKYKYGLIFIAVIGSFLFGFIHTYYDCNRELELKELLSAMESNVDPCQARQEREESFFGFFKQKFTKQQCVEHLLNKNKIKLPFCRPDDVILKYVNDLLFAQIFVIVEKSTDIFRKSFDTIRFPYNIVAGLIFALTLLQFIKLIFKYIINPSVWLKGRGEDSSKDLANDRLTGENLKVLLDSVKLQNQRTSGIQIIENVQIESRSDSPSIRRIENEDVIDAKLEDLTIVNKCKEIDNKS